MSLLDVQASQMVMIHCASCNVPFAIYAAHDRRLRDSHADFYCPSGHCNVYRGQTDLDKAREERDAEQRRNEALKAENERLRRIMLKQKCPHCPKRVANLKQHIRRVHKK